MKKLYTLDKVKKYSVAVAIVTFFMAATPVFAAGPFGFTFADFLSFFGIKSFQQASPPATPTLPVFPTEAQRNDNAVQVFPGNAFGTTTTPVPPTGDVIRKPTPKGFFIQTTTGPTGSDITKSPKNDDNNRGGNENKPDDRGDKTTPKPTRSVTPNTDKAQKLKDIVTRMLDNYLRRLDNYSDFLAKVKTRRDKLAVDGKDVTKLDAFIKTATDDLASARTVLTNARTFLLTIDYTQKTGDVMKLVKDQLTKVRQALTDLHNSMSDVVREIINQSAKTTTETTPDTNGSGCFKQQVQCFRAPCPPVWVCPTGVGTDQKIPPGLGGQKGKGSNK